MICYDGLCVSSLGNKPRDLFDRSLAFALIILTMEIFPFLTFFLTSLWDGRAFTSSLSHSVGLSIVPSGWWIFNGLLLIGNFYVMISLTLLIFFRTYNVSTLSISSHFSDVAGSYTGQ